MRRIIVIAYQLHFSKGSEYSVAWNYINHMNRNNLLTVLYGTSGEFHQIGETSEMENYCKNHQINNVTIIPVKPSFVSNYYDYSILGQIKFYREYRKWHEDVKKTIFNLLEKERYDLIHFLGPIGYREPGYAAGYPLPYIWGPIGGFGGADIKLLGATCSVSGAVSMFVKRILNTIHTNTSIRAKKALRDSDVVICATTQYQDIVNKLIGKKHHSKVLYRAENCINELYDLNEKKFGGKIHLAFIGRIDENKGLIFILKALKKIGYHENIVLDVVGDDRLNGKMQEWSKKNGVDNMINWHGKIPRDKVFGLIRDSHLLLISSLHEGNPTTVWEAMSMGTPVLTLDHKGMHDIVSENAGFKIKVESYSQIVHDIANTFQIIVDNPSILQQKAFAVLEERKQYTWEKRELFFEEVYKIAEDKYNERK